MFGTFPQFINEQFYTEFRIDSDTKSFVARMLEGARAITSTSNKDFAALDGAVIVDQHHDLIGYLRISQWEDCLVGEFKRTLPREYLRQHILYRI